MMNGSVRPTGKKQKQLAYAKDRDARHDRADGCSSPSLGCVSCGCARRERGKEGYPTKAFNRVCSSKREFYSCSEAYPGTTVNNKMVNSDDFIKALKVDPLYSECEYTVYDRRGVESKLNGLYVTVDGGL